MDRDRGYLADPRTSGVQPRMWRSENKVIAGVVGGLAERLTVSPTGLRWFSAILTAFTGFFPLMVVYLFIWSITGVRRTPTQWGGDT
jgi:phage shock protein PspC (stress-responsive transcriptional regulator)